MSDGSCESNNNPWRETVSTIYDELHFGPDSIFTGERRLARKLIAVIEERHPDYFTAQEARKGGHQA